MPDVELPNELTLEQYEAMDAATPGRLEYRGGHAVALAVPSRRHSRIVRNLVAALAPAAETKGCAYFAGDAKVVTPRGDRLIPDVAVSRDPRDLDMSAPESENVICYPWLIIEVVSPDSRAADFGEKCSSYLTIPELRHYIVVETRRREIVAFERSGMDTVRRTYGGPMTFASLPGIEVTVDAVYNEAEVP